jgi:outer membrane protein assembly factor BamE (lipoprotein component of BamABCDE complex)
MKKILLLSIIFLASCSLNKVILHHGVHNLEQKQKKLKLEYSNKNDIVKLIGPPSTQSVFDSEVFIYIERKTSSSKLLKLGKKELIKNDVLILELDNKGILISKKFYNKNDMNQIVFDNQETGINYTKRSFIYNFLSTLGEKIDDPLNKKRIKN